MEFRYPQESIGNTLFCSADGGERRRVYACPRDKALEVCEFTCGEATQVAYDAPTHLHSVLLDDAAQAACVEALSARCGCAGSVDAEGLFHRYFSGGERFLSDLMDELDAQGIPYGYLSSALGKRISYRPAAQSAGNRAGT